GRRRDKAVVIDHPGLDHEHDDLTDGSKRQCLADPPPEADHRQGQRHRRPDTVRRLEILRPAALVSPHHTLPSDARTPAPAATPQSVAASGEPPAREEAPEGYREAIAAHRATWSRQQHTNPKIWKAAERQLRERLREPEEKFADGRQALEELRAKSDGQQRVRASDVSRARALQRLAAERAGLATITPAAAASQRLDRTA
ncbi:hypothetical protein ACH4LI_36660, partial [Streptomyces globisporus]